MKSYNLYDTRYAKRIKHTILRFRLLIAFLSVFMLAFATVSIVLSEDEAYQWLLIINIPIEIIYITVIFILLGVYLPIYKWELQLATRAEQSNKQLITGIISSVNHQSVFYEDQRMVAITVSAHDRNWELYVRPWLFNENLKVGTSCTFEVLSKAIVSFQVGGEQ